MPTISATDSVLLGGLFGSATMARHFDDRARLQAMLDFEAGLAAAEAECGIVPADAAAAIAAVCSADLYDAARLGEATILSGNPAIPLVKALTEQVGGDAARFVHWGATSQDVIDTGLALQMNAGFAVLDAEIEAVGVILSALADAHRKTPTIARTLMQHALPIPFGLRVAGWLDAVTRTRQRVSRLRETALFVHFSGAAGSLAALGQDGPRIAEALARHFNLPLPSLSLHAHRDFVADIGSGLALACGTAAKIAGDIQLMMQTDVGEAFEPAAPGKGGSSTMPHKRNPVATAAIRANTRKVAALSGLLLANMDHAYERDPGAWHAEWGPIAEMFVLTAGALEKLRETLAGLELDTDRMRANIEATNGLVYAEAVMMVLAPHLGKSAAHQLVEHATQRAIAERGHLRDVLFDGTDLPSGVNRAEIVDAFDPAGYFGASDSLIDRARTAWSNSQKTD
ncbi:MAG: 3-carboxy-cis,cis-muconate cycloisomerase [Pseudomonadota bacterium]